MLDQLAFTTNIDTGDEVRLLSQPLAYQVA